jgi:hypothetical protein
MAAGEWLQMEEPDYYNNSILKLLPAWDIDVLRNYVEK